MATQLLRAEPDELRRSRRQTRRALEVLTLHAERAQTVEREANEARADLQRLEQAHPVLATSSLGRTSGNGVLVFSALFAFVFDFVMFNATGEFYARRAFPDSPSLVEVTRFALPAALLSIELSVATHIFAASEERDEIGESWPYYAWIFVGVLFLFVIPTSAIATQLTTRPETLTATGEAAFNWQLPVLFVIPLAAHAVVLFGGRRGHDATVWALFVARRGRLRHVARRGERERRRVGMQAQQTYSRYMSLRETHNASFPDQPIGAGPFTQSTRELLRALAGYEVIVFNDAPAARAVPAADAGIDDETPDRDADTEVKP